MPRRLKLTAFFISSALNALAIAGCLIAITDPLPAQGPAFEQDTTLDA